MFTIIKNADFTESLDSNPYIFRHYDINKFSLFVNRKRVPSKGISQDMDQEKSSVMGYRTLFERSGIHNSNSELQLTHDMYING